MKPLYAIIAFLTWSVNSQAQISEANKCYEEKNYECAVSNYKAAIAARSYQENDYALIKFRIGYGYSQLKKFSDAVAPLREAIASKPDMGQAYWELAYCYFSLNDFEKSVENYAKTAELYKSDTSSLKRIQYWRGRGLAKLTKYADAISAYKAAIAIDSSQSDYYASLGDASYNSAAYKEAIKAYQRAAQLGRGTKADQAIIYYWLGQSYSNSYDRPAALKAYQMSLEQDPTYKWSHWGIASVHYNDRKWKNAIESYTTTINFFKDDTASLKQLYYWRGRNYYETNDYVKAIADYDQTLKIDPSYAAAYWEKGLIARKQKKFREAVTLYSKALDLHSSKAASTSDLYYSRGLSYLALKDTVNAQKDFESAADLDEFNVEAIIELGNLAFARKEYSSARLYYEYNIDDYYSADSVEMSKIYFQKGYANYMSGDTYFYTAKDDFLTSIGFDSSNKEAHRWLCDAYYRQSLFALSEKEMDACIKLYKNNKDSLPNMYLYRGLARYQQKKYKEALTDYEQADKLAPFKQGDYVKTLGQLAFEVKEYDKAIKYFTRLEGMYKPTQKDELLFAYFARGRSYLEQKKKAEALKDLKKAQELAPTNSEVSTWLKKAEALN